MRRPARRGARMRAALDATGVPTWSGPRTSAERTEALRFQRAPGHLARGRRIYAVGDVHGCLAQLRRLHAAIAADLSARPIGAATLLHLGDFIDQGPDSAGVIAHLLSYETTMPVVNLLGDHERMLLDALDGDRAAATDWLHGGGRASLASWGLDPELPRDAWPQAIPAAHVSFLRGLTRVHREGDYLFVHAGIRPGVALARQTLDDLTTIRQPFLWTERELGAVVVHGHSAGPEPVITANRIGLDTGAGVGGKLTCAVLEYDLLGLLAA